MDGLVGFQTGSQLDQPKVKAHTELSHELNYFSESSRYPNIIMNVNKGIKKVKDKE